VIPAAIAALADGAAIVIPIASDLRVWIATGHAAGRSADAVSGANDTRAKLSRRLTSNWRRQQYS
jgi:hypothetical protein